jgi:hypothetical protein
MARIYENLDPAAVRWRAEALQRFSRWEAENPGSLSAAQAISAIGTLYDLLPKESRSRPVDASGVLKLHRGLAVLDRLHR